MICMGAYGTSAAAEPLALAFLEDHYIEDAVVAGKGKRDAYEPALRVAFVRDTNGWQSVFGNPAFQKVDPEKCRLSSFQRLKSWTGFGSYRNEVNAVSTRVMKVESRSLTGLLKLKSPTITEAESVDRLVLYGGHSFAAARKPLALATTKFSFADPEKWVEVDFQTSAFPDFLRAFVQSEFVVLDKCVADVPANKQPIQGELKMNLDGEALRLRRHVKNASEMALWQIEIPQVWIRRCGSEVHKDWNEPRSLRIWVMRDKRGVLRMLGTPYSKRNSGAFDKFELIANNDFDGDGSTELVFWYSGYFHDGYVLLSDGLTKMTTFTWGYH